VVISYADFGYNGNSLTKGSTVTDAIVDTGSSLIYVPPAVWDKLNATLSGLGLNLTCGTYCYSDSTTCGDL
jgi:hypothetical protein